RVPHVPRNGRIHILDGDTSTIGRVVERDVVLQRIGARDVIVVAVLPAPHYPAGLVLPSGDRLEANLDEAVLHRRLRQDAPGERAAARLLQHVGLARRARVLAHGPLRTALAGDALLPSARQCAGFVPVEIDRLRGSGARSENREGGDAGFFHDGSFPAHSRSQSRTWTPHAAS